MSRSANLTTLPYGRAIRPQRVDFWVAISIWLVVVALVGSYFGATCRLPISYSQRRTCTDHLRQIGVACIAYSNSHDNRLPPDLPTLIRTTPEAAARLADLCICPSTRDTPAGGASAEGIADNLQSGAHLSYVYVGGNLTNSAGIDVIVAYDAQPHDDGRNVLYGAGNVLYVPEKEAQRLIAELNAGHNPPRPALSGQ